jgi:hypothetical protein
VRLGMGNRASGTTETLRTTEGTDLEEVEGCTPELWSCWGGSEMDHRFLSLKGKVMMVLQVELTTDYADFD